MDGLSGLPGINVLTSRDAQWEREKAYDVMLDILKEYDDIDVVFGHNGETAFGAYLAAKGVGVEENMTFIGVDGLPGPDGGVRKVVAGIFGASFIYPSGGDKVIRLAVDILSGRKFPRNTTLSTSIVDKSNSALIELQNAQIDEKEDMLSQLNVKLSSISARYARQRILLWGVAIFVAVVLTLLLGTVRGGAVKQLKIFFDRSCMDIFDGSGMSLPSIVFPTEPYNNLECATPKGRCRIKSVKVYPLD